MESGKIVISPFDTDRLNPNSYNFHLSDTLEVYENNIIDPKIPQPTKKITIPEEGYVLQPNQLYLGFTQEVMGGDHYVPFIFGRSSIGRLGLFVQITAPLGDIGFKGRWTLQLTPTIPLRVYSGMRIGQILFIQPMGQISLYEGKYQNATTSRKSEIYQDFAEKTLLV